MNIQTIDSNNSIKKSCSSSSCRERTKKNRQAMSVTGSSSNYLLKKKINAISSSTASIDTNSKYYTNYSLMNLLKTYNPNQYNNPKKIVDQDLIIEESQHSSPPSSPIATPPPIITLNDPNLNNIYITVNGSFTDPGATARDYNGNSIPVNTYDSNFDISIPGTYTFYYSATDDKGQESHALRTIHVVVPAPPTVTLNDPNLNNIYITVNGSFTDPGATARDYLDNSIQVNTYDGNFDISIPNRYTFYYSATDDKGQESHALRTIHVVVPAPPTVTLNDPNPNPINIRVGDSFTDPEATAHDYLHNNLNNIIVSGTVDTQVPGMYRITYTATDENSQIGQATRFIFVDNNSLTLGSNYDITKNYITVDFSSITPPPKTELIFNEESDTHIDILFDTFNKNNKDFKGIINIDTSNSIYNIFYNYDFNFNNVDLLIDSSNNTIDISGINNNYSIDFRNSNISIYDKNNKFILNSGKLFRFYNNHNKIIINGVSNEYIVKNFDRSSIAYTTLEMSGNNHNFSLHSKDFISLNAETNCNLYANNFTFSIYSEGNLSISCTNFTIGSNDTSSNFNYKFNLRSHTSIVFGYDVEFHVYDNSYNNFIKSFDINHNVNLNHYRTKFYTYSNVISEINSNILGNQNHKLYNFFNNDKLTMHSIVSD